MRGAADAAARKSGQGGASRSSTASPTTRVRARERRRRKTRWATRTLPPLPPPRCRRRDMGKEACAEGAAGLAGNAAKRAGRPVEEPGNNGGGSSSSSSRSVDPLPTTMICCLLLLPSALAPPPSFKVKSHVLCAARARARQRPTWLAWRTASPRSSLPAPARFLFSLRKAGGRQAR